MKQLRKYLIISLLPFGLTGLSHAATTGAPTPDGWLPHFESLIAFAVVAMAVLIAFLLNHQNPKLRATGTGLAALSCFGIVAWFGAVLQSGVIANPKPYQVPMDAFKPALLWTQTGVAAVGGLALLIVAIRQMRIGQPLTLSNLNEADRYGRVSRMLHWTTALLFIFMIPTGIFTSMIPEDAWYRTEYNIVHKTVGMTLLGLLIIRLIWNGRSKRPALDGSLKPAERKLAHTAHIILYVLLVAMPVTGYVMTSLHGYPTYFFTLTIDPVLPESGAYIFWGLFHKYLLQYLIYIVLGAHILGALKHQLIDKHAGAFKRMVS